MKKILFLLCISFVPIFTFGQTSGDYRTATATVTWSTAGNWQTFNGTNWVTASSSPGSTSNNVIDQRDLTKKFNNYDEKDI